MASNAKLTNKRPKPMSFNLAEKLRALSGWRRWMTAFAAGILSVIALPPFSAWVVMFITLPVLILLLDGAAAQATTLKQAARSFAATMWWWGFGYFLLGLYWIGQAFIVEGNFIWLMPLAVTLMPAGLALFYAAAGALAVFYWPSGWRRIVVFALLLTAAEWLRGHLFTGFPWNLLGYTLAAQDGLMQLASVFGAYGLTFLAALVFASFTDTGLFEGRFAKLTTAPFPYAALALLISMFAMGQVRLHTGSQMEPQAINLRIVQPAVPQVEKWQPENRKKIFRDYLSLSARKTADRPGGLANVSLLIWPEAALPFLLLRAPYALRDIRKMLPENSWLVTGGNRAEAQMSLPPVKQSPELPFAMPRHRRPLIFNSVLVFDAKARLKQRYDKTHLVPFGEYLPFQGLLEAIGLRQLTRLRGGFEAGRRRAVLAAGQTPAFAPLICYEIIFPGQVVPQGPRPAWLLNLTNDAWFGTGIGPYQHLHQARLRAVEEGLPVVRAANTGISAVIDPYGRIVSQLRLGEKGIIDAKLPKNLPPTLYARYGDGILLLLLIFGITALGFAHVQGGWRAGHGVAGKEEVER